MDSDSFIEEIVANPHDDMARLIFADFLEEQGDPRAELIRLQFEMADLGPFDNKHRKLRSRELKLIRKHGVFGRTPTVAKVLGYHGGFVDAVELTVTRFLKFQDKLFSEAPIRELHLKSKSVKFRQIADSKWLNQLSSLTLLQNKASDDDIAHVISSPQLSQLRELVIQTTHENSDAIVRGVANAQNLETLRALKIIIWALSPSSALAVARSDVLTQLQSLEIGGRQNDRSLEAICQSQALKNLRQLRLRGDITEAGFSCLQHSEFRECLESVQLNVSNVYTDRCVVPDQPFTRLRELTLDTDYRDNSAVMPNFITALLRVTPNLEVLDLTSAGINDRAAESIAQSEQLQRIRKLVLTDNQVTMTGVTAIRESKHFAKGTKLYLRSNSLSVPDIRELRRRYGKSFGNMEPERELRWREMRW